MSFAPILHATRSKFTSEDSKRMKKSLAKKKVINIFFDNFVFCLKSSEMYGKKMSSNSEQKKNVREALST